MAKRTRGENEIEEVSQDFVVSYVTSNYSWRSSFVLTVLRFFSVYSRTENIVTDCNEPFFFILWCRWENSRVFLSGLDRNRVVISFSVGRMK